MIRKRGAKVFCLFFVSLLFLLRPAAAVSAGLFEDPAGLSSFILSPRQPSVAAAMVQTKNDLSDAALFFLHADYPLRSSFLIRIGQSYATVSTKKHIYSGFGDCRIRIRTALLSRPGMVLYMLSGLRTGTGSRRIFPYASGSIDAEVGGAWVDTLSMLSVWGAVTASTVWRGPEGLDKSTAHDNFLTVAVGISLPIRTDIHVEFIGAGYILNSGAARELYTVQASYQSSSVLNFFGTLQAEGGKEAERVNDFTVEAGVRVFY